MYQGKVQGTVNTESTNTVVTVLTTKLTMNYETRQQFHNVKSNS